MFTRAIVLTVGAGAMAIGCGTEPQSGSAQEQQEIIDNLVEAGFQPDDIRVAEGQVWVGNDAQVSLQASQEMLEVVPGSEQEQFRTNNLVAASVANICVNGAAFTGALSTGLNAAIANYNALGLTFRMTRTTGSTAGCNATIAARLTTGTGGFSGFPTGGRPFNNINIGSGMSSFPAGTIEHVITHELGHTVGFRHSDFFNRAISCGGAASNEGAAGIGAVLIPGTPSTAQVGGSIMNSCFRQNENGNFTASDRTALTTLY